MLRRTLDGPARTRGRIRDLVDVRSVLSGRHCRVAGPLPRSGPPPLLGWIASTTTTRRRSVRFPRRLATLLGVLSLTLAGATLLNAPAASAADYVNCNSPQTTH